MTNNTIPNVPRELLERTIDRLKYGHEHDKALRELRAILATAKSAAADDERMRFDLWAEQQGWPKDHTMLHELWLAWKAGALKYAPSPAGVDGCKCSMSISMLGDGCRHCQPQEYIDRLGEMLDEERSELSDAQAIIDGLRGEVADLHTTMMAAAVEIQEHWAAHCDEDGYGPANLMHRLERGIASQYGYNAKTLVRLEAERDQQAQRIGELEGLLREERTYASVQLSCRKGIVARCICRNCRLLRIDAALSDGKEQQ